MRLPVIRHTRPEDTAGAPHTVALLALLAALAVLGGCSTAIPTSPADQLRISEMQQDLLETRRRAVMAEVETERLRSELADLRQQLEVARSRAVTAPASTDARPIDDQVTAIELLQPLEETELEEAVVPPPRPQPQAIPPQNGDTVAPGPATPGSAVDAQNLYDQAYALYHERNYARAEELFLSFLGSYGESHLADNALFWIGECRFARGEYSSALQAFGETVDRYPHGNKVADAMLKAGKCLEALQQQSQAIRTYEELQSRFPDSAAARAASERLAALAGS